MIHLRMEGGVAPPVILGPAPWYRIDENFLRQGPHGAIVATFREHVWEMQSARYIRYHCTDPHIIRFEDEAKGESLIVGQFTNTWVEDGILHPDYMLRARFLFEAQRWHEYRSDTYWPTLVIEAPSEPARSA